MRWLLALLVVLAWTVPVWAAGPVNPTTATATLPQTNTDGSNLVDLAAINFCVGTSATGQLSQCVNVAVPSPDPAPSATVTTPVAAFSLTAEGQFFLDAEAVDQMGTTSQRSTRVPFERRVAPSPPTVTVQ